MYISDSLMRCCHGRVNFKHCLFFFIFTMWKIKVCYTKFKGNAHIYFSEKKYQTSKMLFLCTVDDFLTLGLSW